MRSINFKEWLYKERKSVELHHGTTTGKDDSHLSSFKIGGIKPKSSSGFGQGAGYYSFGSKKRASDHASSLLGSNKPLTADGVSHTGKPMVVTHRADLNPRDYELDKEIQYEDIKKFFMTKVRSINEFLKSNGPIEYEVKGLPTPDYKSKIYHFFKMNYKGQPILGMWVVDNNKLDMSKVKLNDLETNIVFRDDAYSAAELNNVLLSIFKKMPELDYKRFIRSIMKRTAEGRAKPRAWKYVGDKKIDPSEIDVY